MTTTRLERDDYLMRVARLTAKRSTCLRGQVGIVLVMQNRIIATGYNGSPPGQDHCIDVGCEQQDFPGPVVPSPRGIDDQDVLIPVKLERGIVDARIPLNFFDVGCQRTVHAEANALAFAARYGIPTGGAAAISTHSPCRACALLLRSAGVLSLFYDQEYRATPWEVCKEIGLALIPFNQDE